MDDESGDDDTDELTSEWGGESRHDWRGWRNDLEVDSRRGDAYLNERSVICNEEMADGEKGWQQMRTGYYEGVEQRSDC